jgi:NADH:ubiquinone oxidoreductase subunit 6 (subunit J)
MGGWGWLYVCVLVGAVAFLWNLVVITWVGLEELRLKPNTWLKWFALGGWLTFCLLTVIATWFTVDQAVSLIRT